MTATVTVPTPNERSSRPVTPSTLVPGQSSPDAQTRPAGGDRLAGDHEHVDAHCVHVSGSPLPTTSVRTNSIRSTSSADPLAGDQRFVGTQSSDVSGNPLPTAMPFAVPKELVPSAGLLALAAASLDDIERTRIAMGNRLRAMRDDHGLASTPEYQRAELIHDALAAAEHQAILELQRTLRKHPLGPWVKRTIGIGEKQGARLLAALDDPYWNHAEDRPRRGPAELWAYCGLKPGQRRQKGVKSNWNAAAKMRARLCAESCIKQAHSPYRADYDRARANWADRDTSDMHKHNHALHVVAKAILRDLYLEGKALR